MRMAEQQLPLSLLDYDEEDVHRFFTSLGFPQYEAQLREHGISGDILLSLDHDGLRDIGIVSVGQRLVILKAVYNQKLRDGIAIEPDHYIPPSEVADASTDKVSLAQLHSLIQQLERRIASLEEENYHLQETVQNCVEDVIANAGKKDRDLGSHTLKKQPSFKWAQYKGSRSPTRTAAEHESPQSSPQATEHHLPQASQRQKESQDRTSRNKDAPATATGPSIPITGSSITTPAPQPKTTSSSRSNGVTDATDIRSFKVSLDDPAWKVLPAALKKYKINNDDWQNYAMFICYGNTERCLSYDEKPLLLFQKLKDAKKNPVFMLKHIRDIRSPIAVAQQKQAARSREKAATLGNQSTLSLTSTLSKSSAGAAGRSAANATSNGKTPPLSTANLNSSSWPDVLSPTTAHTEQPSMADQSGRSKEDGSSADHHGTPPPGISISYAVAIYPYSAEQEDEFDVTVNDTFIILSRARGWWVVQRDPYGTGQLDGEPGQRQGWVPAGCLLETNQPVALAIQEATPYRSTFGPDRTPIMPASIVSTSYPGIALMDYRRKGDEELDLIKDDTLRVFKRYNHWSYAVKEENGERGWVPSWFIGKIGSSAAGVPPTPGPAATSTSMGQLESDLRYALEGAAGSPISPGFGSTSHTSPPQPQGGNGRGFKP